MAMGSKSLPSLNAVHIVKWTALSIALRCPNSTTSRMHTNRHHVGLNFCAKALSKGIYCHLIVWMPANMRYSWNGALTSLKNISQALPDWLFPNGTGSSAQQSPPDAIFVRKEKKNNVGSAIFVRSIPGRPAHIDPIKIPP
eukprot:1159067-Pelagomonas_calceolata.AAC.10